VRLVGLAVAVAGAALAVRSAMLLAGRGRPRRGPVPPLILAGPYVRVRNPLLAGLLVMLAGAALATQSWALGAATAAVALAAHLWVVRVEEPRLAARFGATYGEYRRRIPRWLPRRQGRTDRE
jgi:protein-S-isoprenylcysteine O-methyltransferase Ste14